MIPQSRLASDSTQLHSHLHFGLESCPTCGQQIPPEKVEEIGGKIAAWERGQTVMITAQIEKQYAIEKARTESKAKADLESERQQSTIREARARDEAQKAAEKLISEKLAEAEQTHAGLVAGWQRQLTEAQSAKKSAEGMWTNLQAEMNQLREDNATSIEGLKGEAKKREIEIRNEAERTAGSAAAERIAAIETAQRESEAELKAQISA